MRSSSGEHLLDLGKGGLVDHELAAGENHIRAEDGGDGGGDANKIEIKKAIEEIFGVTVIKVTTTHMRAKSKRQGAYPAGKTAAWKKAVVKLSADSKNIELFEGMA